VNWSAEDVALVPPTVVTVTWTVPADPAGEVTVIWVAESTITLAAAVAPKCTDGVPVKPVPVIVTDIPPTTGPAAGEIPVTVGAGI